MNIILSEYDMNCIMEHKIRVWLDKKSRMRFKLEKTKKKIDKRKTKKC